MRDHQGSGEYLTTSDVAHRLKVSAATVKRWRREGTGPPWYRVGRAVRYRAAEVERWVEGRPQREEE